MVFVYKVYLSVFVLFFVKGVFKNFMLIVSEESRDKRENSYKKLIKFN